MNVAEFYAGQYEQRYQYKSFLPASLNQSWEITDSNLILLMDEASRLLGELNAFSQLVPDVDFFIQMHIAKEAVTSSRIEGTQTNMEEALIEEQDINPEKRDDWHEVQNYIQAIHYAVNELRTLPLSNRLLRDTHRILLQGVRGKYKQPGEFRRSQNWIGASLEQAVFVPPHHIRIPELMSDLEKFMHNEDVRLPHLLKIAMIHYQFETIHPFLDGNGRLGRLLIVLYMITFGLQSKPALYLSDFFERNKEEYYDRLTAVRTANNMPAWLLFFLQGVKETAQRSIHVFKEILALKEQIEREKLPLFHHRKQANARKLMRSLYKHPIINVRQVSARLDVPPNTAGRLVNDFIKFDILREITGYKRNRLYVFVDYMQLFR